MNENYLGVRFTNPKRLMDNAILSAAEAAAVRDMVSSNILIYGAVPGDVVDNTNAFNAALADAALASNSCVVYVPKGTYLITGTITIPVGVQLIGECRVDTILHFTGTAAQYDAILMNGNTMISNIRTLYTGGNVTTSSAISILGSNVIIKSMNIGSAITETETAFGVSFDFAAANTVIYDSLVHGVINAVRFVLAAARSRITNALLNCGTAGTVINFTNAGGNNLIADCFLRANGGASTGIDTGAASITSIGNNYATTTPVTGAGLLTSTIVDNSTTVNFNTTANYAVDGVKVVGNQETGWAVIGGYTFTPSRGVLNSGTVTLPQLADQFITLLNDLGATNGHGLITS